MNGQNKEKQISISCLLWNMLYKWRSILIMAILFAVLFGGLQYMRASKSNVQANNSKNISVQDIKAGLSDKEKVAVEQAKEIKKNLDDKKEYKSNSTVMNIDPYAKNIVTLQYFADTKYSINLSSNISKDHTSGVVTAYIAYVMNQGYLSALDMKDTSNIGELVKAQASTTADDGAFSVIVSGKDADSAEKLAEKIDTVIKAYQPTVSEKVANNTLTLVDRYNSVVSDDILATAQVTLNTAISDLQTKLDTLTATFSPNQLQVYNDKVITNNTSVTVRPAISVKYIIFGALIGIFLYIAWIVVIYILDGKIKSAKELQDIYNIRVLGSVKQFDSKKKQVLGGVDRWIDKIRYHGGKSYEEQNKLIASKIISSCKKENIQNLFITSSLLMDEKDCETIKIIMQLLETAGIEVTFGDNNNYNIETVSKIADMQNIVIVEKVEKSKYDLVEQEISLCLDQKMDILGIVVLE